MSASTRAFEIDVTSLLAGVPASMTIDDVEAALSPRGLTLGVARDSGAIDRGRAPIGTWLEEGAPGARSAFADPADHLVAGLEATLTNGARLDVRPSPRRAVGPDLTALVLSAARRFASIDYAWLRVHRVDARRHALPLPVGVDLDPPLELGEAALLDAIERELRRS